MTAPGEIHLIRGLRVVVHNSRPDIDTAAALGRLDAALRLIEAYAPRTAHRLSRDLTEIWVRRYPCRAAFAPDARACLVELTFLAHPDITPTQVAASIVHEAMHARLLAMGVRVTPAMRAREERLCRTVEMEFGRAAPDGGPVVARAAEALALADDDVAPTIDWGLASRRVSEVDAAALQRSVED